MREIPGSVSAFVHLCKPYSSHGREFWDPPPFHVSHYVQEYASYLDAVGFTDMRASDRALSIRDWHSLLRGSNGIAWVKCWLHCGGHGMYVLRRVGSGVDCPIFRCLERLNMRWIFRRLCDVLIGSRYRSLFRRLPYCVVRLVPVFCRAFQLLGV